MCLGDPLARGRQDRAFRLGCQGRHICSSFPLALASRTSEETFLVFCLIVAFWPLCALGSPPCPTENQLRQPPWQPGVGGCLAYRGGDRLPVCSFAPASWAPLAGSWVLGCSWVYCCGLLAHSHLGFELVAAFWLPSSHCSCSSPSPLIWVSSVTPLRSC